MNALISMIDFWRKWKILLIVLFSFILFAVIGHFRNDVVEIHDNGASMCFECIGLE